MKVESRTDLAVELQEEYSELGSGNVYYIRKSPFFRGR